MMVLTYIPTSSVQLSLLHILASSDECICVCVRAHVSAHVYFLYIYTCVYLYVHAYIYMHASVHNFEVKQQLMILINISVIINNARYFHAFVGYLCFEVSLFRSPAHS